MRFGQQSFQQLDGMFAGSYYNCNDRSLLLFRDPVGQKPLYYYLYEGGLIYSSELRALLEIKEFNWKIDKSNFHNHALTDVPEEWANYEAIICNPIHVNRIKKIKMIKRGLRSIIKKPGIFFNENKQSLVFHFDMHHGYGNLDKAIDVMNTNDREDFREYANTKNYFSANNMFIAKKKVIEKWLIIMR